MPKLTAEEKSLLPTAVALLRLRHEGGDAFKKAAIERRIAAVPPNVVAYAEKYMAKEIKKERQASTGPKATLVEAKLTTTEMSGGHVMAFEMSVDIPRKPPTAAAAKGEEDFARDLYGVYFEWWEEIVVEYDFTEPPVDVTDEKAVEARDQRIADKIEAGEGGWHKPWSDIYLSNPISITFDKWSKSLAAAAAGQLPAGLHTTGVTDKPAIGVSAAKFRRRILRFRINAGDAQGVKFTGDALQVCLVEDGQLRGILYQDSLGTTLLKGEVEAAKMAYSSKVGLDLRHNVANDFVVALESDQADCDPYDNVELTALKAKCDELGWQDIVYAHKDLNDANKTYILPLIPAGDEYWSRSLTGGAGMLIGQLSGGKVKRLWHTDEATVERESSINGTRVKFQTRVFEQLPLS